MVAKGRPAPFKSNLSSAHDGPHVADHEESSLTARLHPPLQDPIERGQRLLETFLVLVVQTAGLEGDAADGLGNLVASAEQLVVQAFEHRPLGVISERVQFFKHGQDPLFTRAKRLFELRPFEDVPSLRVGGVVKGIELLVANHLDGR